MRGRLERGQLTCSQAGGRACEPADRTAAPSERAAHARIIRDVDGEPPCVLVLVPEQRSQTATDADLFEEVRGVCSFDHADRDGDALECVSFADA